MLYGCLYEICEHENIHKEIITISAFTIQDFSDPSPPPKKSFMQRNISKP